MPIERFTCTLKGTPSGDQVSTRLDSASVLIVTHDRSRTCLSKVCSHDVIMHKQWPGAASLFVSRVFVDVQSAWSQICNDDVADETNEFFFVLAPFSARYVNAVVGSGGGGVGVSERPAHSNPNLLGGASGACARMSAKGTGTSAVGRAGIVHLSRTALQRAAQPLQGRPTTGSPSLPRQLRGLRVAHVQHAAGRTATGGFSKLITMCARDEPKITCTPQHGLHFLPLRFSFTSVQIAVTVHVPNSPAANRVFFRAPFSARKCPVCPSRSNASRSGSREGSTGSASSTTSLSVGCPSPPGCAGARQMPPNSVDASARCCAQLRKPHQRRRQRDRTRTRRRRRSWASLPQRPHRPPTSDASTTSPLAVRAGQALADCGMRVVRGGCSEN